MVSQGEGSGSGGIGRRRFLLGAAGLGAAAWAAPVIITMDPAGAAALTSPPPKPPDTEVRAQTVEVRGAEVTADPRVASDDGGHLPFTGANLEQLTIAGLAATASGAAMHYWSARTGTVGRKPVDPPPA